MNRAPRQIGQCVESRFQRLLATRLISWGDAPGLNDDAPLALDKAFFCSHLRAGRDWFSAKGATLIDSLGQRPRISGNAKSASPAGAGQFIPEERP
jgi:hypothetical protein